MCLARHCVRCIGHPRDTFPGRSTQTQPLVFTFEPIPDRRSKMRIKKRPRRVLYPSHQVRRSLPTQKDMTKRMLLFLVSIVLFQVYIATEDDEPCLSSPDLGAAKPVLASVQTPSSWNSTVILAPSPGAEASCSQHLAGGRSLQTAQVILSYRL